MTSSSQLQSTIHMMKKFSFARQALLLGLFLNPTLCTPSRHHTGPVEENVFSPPICTTNQDGFGGAIGTDIFTVSYTYEMEMNGNRQDPVDFLIFSLERSVADFFLQSTIFQNVPCNRRQLHVTAEEVSVFSNGRRLVPVGISINPDDEPTTLTCVNNPAPGNECLVVEGKFQVYTVGNNPQDDELPETLGEDLKSAMNNGDFDDAHPEIVQVTYVEPQAISDTDGLTDSDPNQVRSSVSPSPNAPVIIGASVGALLVLGALAFYRRRQNKDDQADVTTMGGNSTMGLNSNLV